MSDFRPDNVESLWEAPIFIEQRRIAQSCIGKSSI